MLHTSPALQAARSGMTKLHYHYNEQGCWHCINQHPHLKALFIMGGASLVVQKWQPDSQTPNCGCCGAHWAGHFTVSAGKAVCRQRLYTAVQRIAKSLISFYW